jgi:hypothetical protein
MLSHIRHLLIDQLRQQKEQGKREKKQVTLQFHTKASSSFLSKKNTFLS